MKKKNLFYTFMFSSLLSLPAIEKINVPTVNGVTSSDQRLERVYTRNLTSLVNKSLLKVTRVPSIKKQLPAVVIVKDKKSIKKFAVYKKSKNLYKKDKAPKYISQKINLISSSISKKIIVDTDEKDISNYELRSKELTTHYGFNIKHDLKLIDFKSFKIHLPVKVKKYDVLANSIMTNTDKVRLISAAIVRPVAVTPLLEKTKANIKINNRKVEVKALAAIQKTKINRNLNVKEIIEQENDQLVSFDYSAKEGEIDLTLAKPLISKSVLDSVNRIMASQGKTSLKKKVALPSVQKNQIDQVKLLMASHKRKTKADERTTMTTQKKTNLDKRMSGLFYDQGKDDYSKNDKISNVLIKAIDIHIDSIGSDILTNFEFIPAHDENLRFYDDASGELEIEQKLNNELSLLSGRIVSRDGVTTHVTLPMEQGMIDFNIPVLNKDNFSNFLIKENMNVPGGFLLIKFDSETDSVDISSHYSGRIFLDEDFKVTSKEVDYHYVLYAGIKPGNTLLRLLNFNGEIAEKIIHITENEIFYERVSYIASHFEKFEVRESRLLGKKGYELNIDGDNISYFNTKTKSKNISINTYKIKNPLLVLGMRKYYEFNHLEHSIFVGKWKNTFVEIPGADYIDYIFDAFTLESLEGRCMVQVNLSDPSVDFTISGGSEYGAMNLEVKFLDEDGLFNDEITPLAKKVFIIGEHEGIINYKISYDDSSSDIVQSTCSSSSYLVEQL